MEFILILIAIVTGLVYWFTQYMQRFKILEKCGIPHPKPKLFFGNLKEYNSMPNVHWDTLIANKFGTIAGYYMGTKPVILITDQDFIKDLETKYSNISLDRPRRVPGGINPDPKRKLMLGNLPVPQWKELRKKMNYNFSLKNLKLSFVKMDKIIDKCIQKIEVSSRHSKEMDFYGAFQGLTLDIIANSVFGIDSNVQNDSQDPILKAVIEEFSKTTNSTMISFILCFPMLAPFIQKIRQIGNLWKTSKSAPLWNIGKVALENTKGRNDENSQKWDFISNLIKAGVPEEQIVANTVLIFEAAYETLSSCLAFTVHFLVNNPDIQKKVREELIDINFDVKEEEALYENIKRLEYLEKVIFESLRILPPQTTFIGRSLSEDITLERNDQKYMIPKGVQIQVGLYQIHHSPDHWTNPETFNPDRFDANGKVPEESKYMFQAFGFGRRLCAGHLYAKFVLKLTLGKILKQFILKSSKRTEVEVTLDYKVATMTPRNGSWALAEQVF